MPLRPTLARSALASRHSRNRWTPRSEAIFAFPLARKRTSGKQYRLAPTGVYAPSLRSPWRAAKAQKSLEDTGKRRPKPLYKHIRANMHRDEADTLQPAREEICRCEVQGVIRGFRWQATHQQLTDPQRKPVDKACGYLEKNAHRMRYHEYLTAGYPIASGVIEGACRHGVVDRMEGTGMRWVMEGAQSMLKLVSYDFAVILHKIIDIFFSIYIIFRKNCFFIRSISFSIFYPK